MSSVLKQLQEFPCDVCGHQLADIGMANILWTYRQRLSGELYAIVHKACDRERWYPLLWWDLRRFWNHGKLAPPFGKHGGWFTKAVLAHITKE